jgi:hypothetical protein
MQNALQVDNVLNLVTTSICQSLPVHSQLKKYKCGINLDRQICRRNGHRLRQRSFKEIVHASVQRKSQFPFYQFCSNCSIPLNFKTKYYGVDEMSTTFCFILALLQTDEYRDIKTKQLLNLTASNKKKELHKTLCFRQSYTFWVYFILTIHTNVF